VFSVFGFNNAYSKPQPESQKKNNLQYSMHKLNKQADKQTKQQVS